jgi:hypothetical protein
MGHEVNVQGVILPNELLSNLLIIDADETLEMPHFRGIYCRNELSLKPNVNEYTIINLDDSHGKGTHWCCWFNRSDTKYYFDSYCLQPLLN